MRQSGNMDDVGDKEMNDVIDEKKQRKMVFFKKKTLLWVVNKILKQKLQEKGLSLLLQEDQSKQTSSGALPLMSTYDINTVSGH